MTFTDVLMLEMVKEEVLTISMVVIVVDKSLL